MFDYHMHSTVSFDGKGAPEEMLAAAVRNGLKEICFTDHIDYLDSEVSVMYPFEIPAYRAAYESMSAPGLKIRRGVEYGLLPDNQEQMKQDLAKYPFDYVIGSVHLVDGEDVYVAPYWEEKTVSEVYERYLQEVLTDVRAHDEFDVLGHLTYISKCRGNPTKTLIHYEDYPDLIDAILTELVRKGKGMEANTSGIDRCGDFLPDERIFRRFRELGGEIVTVGSDAHSPDRVGQYTDRACRMLGDIFGYVCTFEDRKPIFHKI